MRRYSIELRTEKYVKAYGFLLLLDARPDTVKPTSKKVVHKAGEFTGKKIADAATKSNDDKIVKQVPVEEITIPPENKDEISNKLRRVL